MNIGHDLMRRLGPRREHEPAPSPPSPHRQLAAIAVTVAGIAGIAALGIAGRTSERAAQGAVAVAGALLAVAIVSRIVGWLRAPVNGNDSSFDAGDAFDRLVTPRDIRSLRHVGRAWTASPMRGALTVLATFALVVAFGLAVHRGWLPATRSSRGPRGALAPAPAAPAPPPAPNAPPPAGP
jgi:hypothetical protein